MITKERVRDILMRFTFVSLDQDGDSLVVLAATEERKFPVGVVFSVLMDGGRLEAWAYASDMEISAELSASALLFCNRWNRDYGIGRAYLDCERHRLALRASLKTDQDVSDAFIKDCFLSMIIGGGDMFYTLAYKELFSQMKGR